MCVRACLTRLPASLKMHDREKESARLHIGVSVYAHVCFVDRERAIERVGLIIVTDLVLATIQL